MGKKRVAYIVIVGKCKGKNPLGRPRRRWEDLQDTGREGVY
jgi:hypothetical protein